MPVFPLHVYSLDRSLSYRKLPREYFSLWVMNTLRLSLLAATYFSELGENR